MLPTLGLARAAALGFGISALIAGAHAAEGQPCSITRNRLAQDTNQFLGDCGYTGWCGTDNVCHNNGCRRDEYPFGYTRRSDWPEMCPEGQFCPDELDSCRAKLPYGSPCQLNRDDQCQDPPADLMAAGVESICLKYKCEYKNQTAGLTCINENTVYTVYETAVLNYGDIVSRDNCRKEFYCNAPNSVCRDKKNIGEACAADKECNSYHCEDHAVEMPDQRYNNVENGRCAPPPVIRSQPSAWIYVIVALGLVVGGLGLCVGLVLLHAKGRRQRNEEARSYYETQALLRDDILETYEAAKLTISRPGSRSASHRNSMSKGSAGHMPTSLSIPSVLGRTPVQALDHEEGTRNSPRQEEDVVMAVAR